MAKVPLVMRLGSASGVGWMMARMPPTERAVRMMLRQIGLGAALDSGRFDQVSLDWFVSLLRDTHTMRNEFAAAPKLISPISGLNEEVLLSARLLAEIHVAGLLPVGLGRPERRCRHRAGVRRSPPER